MLDPRPENVTEPEGLRILATMDQAGPPLDRAEFERWRAAAESALESARREASAGAHHWACFLSEQSAQLALKGLLHGIGKAPWGHDLVALTAATEQAGLEVPGPVKDGSRRLGRLYAATRYPDAHEAGPPAPHYGASDSADAIRDAEAVLAFVSATWSAR